MTKKKISKTQANAMHRLLTEIHEGLKDRNRNKNFKQIPFIEFAWMIGIEKFLPKQKKIIHNNFKKGGTRQTKKTLFFN